MPIVPNGVGRYTHGHARVGSGGLMIRVRGRGAAGLMAASAAAAVLGLPTVASAASAPACDPAVYPRPFLTFESVYKRSTRFVQLRERENMTKPREQGDVEYPFPVTVDLTKSPSFTRMIHSYPKGQVPVRFKRGEKATVTATYVEVHTEYDILGPHHVRCTQVVRTHYKAPPGPNSPNYHR
jgi:hypothetical protein